MPSDFCPTDVNAFWKWDILLTAIDPRPEMPAVWQLRMNAEFDRHYLEHRQIKSGETTDVVVDLDDPPFTFAYVPLQQPDGIKIRPKRRLPPGAYRLTATIALKPPFGPDAHLWEGPLTTAPVKITIPEPPPAQVLTAEEIERYDRAIDGVMGNLQGGLFMNGGFPKIDLPKDTPLLDVVAEVVNQGSFGTKVFTILRDYPLDRPPVLAGGPGSAVLIRVRQSFKVVIMFPLERQGWWTRSHDVQLPEPARHEKAP